jgi:hypothetical protein
VYFVYITNYGIIDIIVRDYILNPEPIEVESQPVVESLRTPEVTTLPRRTMNLRSVTYHTAHEVRNSLFDEEGVEDENDITTDSSNDSEPNFDSSDDDEFDPILGNDYIAEDDFMDVD